MGERSTHRPADIEIFMPYANCLISSLVSSDSFFFFI